MAVSKGLVIPTRERSEEGEPALSEAEGNLLPAGSHPPWPLDLLRHFEKTTRGRDRGSGVSPEGDGVDNNLW